MEQENNDESAVKNKLHAIKQKIKAADAAFEAKQALLQEIKTSWNDGSIEMTKGRFETETKHLEEEIGDLLVAKAAMRASKYELAGRELDAERWDKSAHAEDWAYLDLLLSRLKEPSGSTVTMKNPRDPSQQSRWRQAVLTAYNAEEKRGAWCPISQRWFPKSHITAAHIIRYNVTEMAAVHLFGAADKASGHIWSTQNGIPLLDMYEAMLDDAKIAIVPTQDSKDLMVIVLDQDILEDEEEHHIDQSVPFGRKLHGRILQFRNDYRPAMRYLYFNFAMNILRRQRYAVDGWWRDRVEYAGIPFFPTPGKWIKETTLRKLAIRIGHLPEKEARSFVGKEGSDGSEEGVGDEEKEELITSCLQHAYRN
ncbi:hypothetical protein GGS24DRAFT_506400 [Hypoxylon argillaceum]|nr:hypothetical protein GGS24DRAFT_506400 [Hypoxylon argillaceum]